MNAAQLDPRFGDGNPNVLIVALDTVLPAELPHAEVVVVAPALNSWLRHWVSDEDGARRRAQARVAAFVDVLERHGAHVEGRVGDADPLQAIADVLATFPADEIVIAARPERSTRLADDLVSRARDRFALPVHRAGESLPRAA
jgi:nucleotide-binding universal stress UspA family protein